MKKVLSLGILLSMLLIGHVFAAPAFTATLSGSTLTASLSGVGTATNTYRLIVLTKPFPSGNTPPATYKDIAAVFNTADTDKQPYQGTVKWNIVNYTLIQEGGTYYVRAVKIGPNNTLSYASNAIQIKPAVVPAPTISLLPLKVAPAADGDTSDFIVTGQIDITKIPNFNPSNFSAQLSYSPAVTGTALSGNISGPFSADVPVAANGTYSWRLKGIILSPSTTYYLQQKVTDNVSKTSVTDPAAGQSPSHFNTADGVIVVPNTVSEDTYNSEHGYKLLAPFPNFSFLPDPQLCAEQRAAGKTPGICDINDFINYGLKLLIGLAAVFLVIKLMVDGYNIMVSDVPFLKISAKNSFLQSLLGLVLALTAYLILNTINPKLVDGNLNVNRLDIGVDGDTNTATTFVPNGQKPNGVSCPGTGRSTTVAAIAQSFAGRVTYAMGGKSAAAQSGGFAILDCSGWANTVLNCAGYKTPGDYINSGSTDIFAAGEKVNMKTDFVASGGAVSIKGKPLNPGDLVGWPKPAGGGAGHVILYVGGGRFMDSHSTSVAGGAIGSYDAAKIQSLYGGSTPSKTITALKRTGV